MTVAKPGIARREFLTSLGKAVGGSAMLRAMLAMGIGTTVSACGPSSAAATQAQPPAPPPRPMSPRPGDWPANIGAGKSVVILGAGISGMTAALEMTRLGYSCTILEARASAGGRVRTIRAGDVVNETDSSQTCQFDVDDDLYFNAGPSRIAQHHEFLLGYCRDFGANSRRLRMTIVELGCIRQTRSAASRRSQGDSSPIRAVALRDYCRRPSIRTRWTRSLRLRTKPTSWRCCDSMATSTSTITLTQRRGQAFRARKTLVADNGASYCRLDSYNKL